MLESCGYMMAVWYINATGHVNEGRRAIAVRNNCAKKITVMMSVDKVVVS
jgi:hypothetical protein